MHKHSLRCSIFAAFLILVCSESLLARMQPTQQVKKITLSGYIGGRYADCMNIRVKRQNVDTLISVFQKQDEVHQMWGTEFWGKWVQGAIGMYHYTQDPELRTIIQDSENRLIATQLKDGYIGNYDKDHQLTGWDVWGRKYTILGLLKWYWEVGDKQALNAACRLLDYTMTQLGPGKEHIYNAGLYKGMPPSSILEPVMFLYNTTHDQRYLDFAKYIVQDDETSAGPQLIAKANVPVSKRFPIADPKDWWTALNGQKAYEMMSCYVGMLELYKVTGDKTLFDAAKTAYKHIVDEEINICGSGASYECWYGGKEHQQRVAMHTMETCVTFTWMQFCERLLELTDDPSYVDQIELSMYNALMASMKDDGSMIVKYTPLEGYRHEGEEQCHIPTNCCSANGPRAFAMIPRVQYRLPETNRIDVNLYIPSTAEIQLGKRTVSLTQETDYPKTNSINLIVNPDKQAAFTIALRIPAWSNENVITVNGQKQEGVKAGSYYLINRIWNTGDKISINFELKAKVEQFNHMQAIKRGPIVLARDSRFHDGFVDETCVIPNHDGIVNLEPVSAPKGIWMAFRINMLRGAYPESEEDKEMTYFCDFASAGNTWDKAERYRVWLPRTLNERFDPFDKSDK